MRNVRLMQGLAVVVASVAILALAGSVQAGLIAGGVDAMPGYFGERTFEYSAAEYTLDATVDFAVYATDQYPGTDPSAGSDYVYAYQVFVDPSSTVGTGYFSVGLASGSGAHHPGDDTSAARPAIPAVRPMTWPGSDPRALIGSSIRTSAPARIPRP